MLRVATILILSLSVASLLLSCSPSPEGNQAGGSSRGPGGGPGGGPGTQQEVFDNPVYVSPSGDDANDGLSKDRPVKTIQVAIQKAVATNRQNILIQSGVYSVGSGLNDSGSGVVISNNNIRLIGGWNSAFSSVVGYSELDGGGSLTHII
ncbi:MAG: hypothetical protein RMJ37_05260, partial [Spirochaetia bacterium]|nr:hypothetical protein [Spirochaetota bacterium]MDW8112727.1 hypothetical protein [Spirochaetia bacterium]